MVRRLRRSRRGVGVGVVGAALALGLTACQTPLGQAGFDNANTSSNPAETTLDATNVGTVVSKFDTDLTGYGTVTNLGEPVFAANGNIIVTTDDQVVSVRPDGTVAWNVTIPDAHPEIDAPHIISVYGGYSTVDVLVDTKVQGAAPSYAGGTILKLDNESGALTTSQDTFRPAAPLGYANSGLVITGEVTDHADYGPGRTVTVDVAGSGRRIIRNTVGAVQKPAVIGDQVVVAIGDSLYQWSTPCAAGTVCNESTAAVTAVAVGDPARPGGDHRVHHHRDRSEALRHRTRRCRAVDRQCRQRPRRRLGLRGLGQGIRGQHHRDLLRVPARRVRSPDVRLHLRQQLHRSDLDRSHTGQRLGLRGRERRVEGGPDRLHPRRELLARRSRSRSTGRSSARAARCWSRTAASTC